MNKTIFGLFILFLLVECNAKKNHVEKYCIVNKHDLLSKFVNRFYQTNRDNGVDYEFRDKADSGIRGSYYVFYRNSNLRYYYFFDSTDSYTYSQHYDSTGNYVGSEGVPVVASVATAIGTDSAWFKLYLVGLNLNYDSLVVKTSDGRVLHPQLVNDTLYSNIKSIEFGYGHLKDGQHLKSNFYVFYNIKCSSKKQDFGDSILMIFHLKKK
jgi:hypothetical protein